MNFKTHLLIISTIIIALYVITQIIMVAEKQQPIVAPVEQPAVISAYSIAISRASWGLNCRTIYSGRVLDKNTKNNNFVEDSNDNDNESSKIKDNNVLYNVSQLCNGKPKCDILIDPSVLGEDPLPSCAYKELQIEYRCFAIDRLRRVKTMDGSLAIDCDKQVKL